MQLGWPNLPHLQGSCYSYKNFMADSFNSQRPLTDWVH